MTTAPRLLDQLATLTSIRDLELIEFSLLKTLQGFLQPRSLSILRLDGKGQPTMEIVYGEDKCAMRSENLALSDELRRADAHLSSCEEQHATIETADGVMELLVLSKLRTSRSYLQIAVATELSTLDRHMVDGVLQIYRNFVSLMQHSQTDQLTGLANRKTFDDCVAKVHDLISQESDPILTERRDQRPVNYWLVMVDIDHFKSVNDRFGHLYGDEVLVLMAQLMQASFRQDDMIFRFGGEEFVLIVRGADQAACKTTLERFRQRVEHHAIPQVGTVTISMGVTQMESTTFVTTMVDRADQALYYSKRNGRNQVTFFEDMVAQGLATVEDIKLGELAFF